MATGTWIVGYDKSVTFGSTSLKVVETTWDEEIEPLMVTHSQSGGVEGWIAGVLKGQGSIRANINAAQMPYSISIYAGAQGTMTWGIGGTTAFSIPFGITSVNYKSAVMGLVEYSFNIKLNSEQGTYVRAA